MSRQTITFEPDQDVQRMLNRALKTDSGIPPRGLKSHLVNQALRELLTNKGFLGKRDLPPPEKIFAAK